MSSRPLPDLDPAVIAAAQAGDEQAHAAIYAHYSRRIFTLIYRLVPRRPQAEDLMQEVFLEVLRCIRAYSGVGSFGGWLHSIAVNKSLSHLRSPWRRSMLWLEDAPQPEEFVTAPEDGHLVRAELETALRQLAPLSRAVVWLHDVEGFTHAEIGAKLGRTASFSKSQLSRAHGRLRDMLVPVSTPHPDSRNETLSCTPVTQSLSPSS